MRREAPAPAPGGNRRSARSPKTSISSSPTLSMTAGCWSNLGAELTMPNSVTTRVNLSRSPISVLMLARQLSMTSRAASYRLSAFAGVHSYAFISMPTHVPNSPGGRRPRRSRAAVPRLGCRAIAESERLCKWLARRVVGRYVRDRRRIGRVRRSGVWVGLRDHSGWGLCGDDPIWPLTQPAA
jgi:hypothetical protein